MITILQSVKDRKIIGNFSSVKDFISHLKDSTREDLEIIQKLRQFENKSDEYTDLKRQLRAVTFNFTFKNDYVAKDNAENPTGFLYFDIDNYENFDFDVTYVKAFWKSVGGKGFGVLVQVDNLIPSHFKQSYEFIATTLGFPYDKACNNVARLNFISYDDGAYFNESAEVFDLAGFNSQFVAVKKIPHLDNKEYISSIGYYNNGGEVRFDNLSDVQNANNIVLDDYEYYFTGKKPLYYCKCYFPHRKVEEGKREKKLSSFCHCLVSINPHIDYETLFYYANLFNDKKCFPLLSKKEISEIVNKKIALCGKIKPIENTPRKFFYGDAIKSDVRLIKSINGKVLGNNRSKSTQDELFEILKKWDFERFPKITQKNLRLVSEKNKKTIEKHYRTARNRLDEYMKGELV